VSNSHKSILCREYKISQLIFGIENHQVKDANFYYSVALEVLEL
jgi:hypothetical protein